MVESLALSLHFYVFTVTTMSSCSYLETWIQLRFCLIPVHLKSHHYQMQCDQHHLNMIVVFVYVVIIMLFVEESQIPY